MVEWKKMGDVTSYFRGVTYNKKQEVSLNSGGTKILRANNITSGTNSLNFEDIKEISSEVKIRDNQWLYPNDILICAGSGSKEHVGKVAYIYKPLNYAFGGFMGKIVASKELNPRYLFHVISSSLFKKYLFTALNSTTINNLSVSIVYDFLIPIPSLAEQNRIVGILDTFTESIENIKKQIQLRKKQYEYYRDQLLDLEGKPGVQMLSLKTLFDTRNGYTPSTKNESFWKGGNIPWFRMEDIREKGKILSDSFLHITNSAVKGKGLFKANSIILATSATIGEHALIKVPHLSNQRFTNFYPKSNYLDLVNMKFVYYYMFKLDEWCKQHTHQGGFASVDMDGLYKYIFPLPPLSEQSRIVSILDQFESSISNLEQQLIQRQKQYEFYRNKLLTFE